MTEGRLGQTRDLIDRPGSRPRRSPGCDGGDLMLRLHHIAVETDSVQNSIEWYDAFLGCRPNWSLSTFSELTHDRLPGIRNLVEITNGDVCFHVFERDTPSRHPLDPDSLQFQHVALEADSSDDLVRLRRRWFELYLSGRFTFTRPDPPSEIVCDDDGTQTFYCFDPNGLELELNCHPRHRP